MTRVTNWLSQSFCGLLQMTKSGGAAPDKRLTPKLPTILTIRHGGPPPTLLDPDTDYYNSSLGRTRVALTPLTLRSDPVDLPTTTPQLAYRLIELPYRWFLPSRKLNSLTHPPSRSSQTIRPNLLCRVPCIPTQPLLSRPGPLLHL